MAFYLSDGEACFCRQVMSLIVNSSVVDIKKLLFGNDNDEDEGNENK